MLYTVLDYRSTGSERDRVYIERSIARCHHAYRLVLDGLAKWHLVALAGL